MTHSSNHQHLSPWSTITSLSHMFNFKLDVSIWRIATRASHTNTKIATLPEADLGALLASDAQCSGLTTHPTQSTIRVVNLILLKCCSTCHYLRACIGWQIGSVWKFDISLTLSLYRLDALNDNFFCHWLQSMTLLLNWAYGHCHWLYGQWQCP